MQHLWTNPKIASNLLAVCVAFLLIQGTLAEAQSSVDKAWNVLQAGLSNTSTDRRARAVRVLGLLEKDRKAPELGLQALADAKPEVRAAAADALGQMKATAAAPKLGAVITGDEKDAAVIMACARSMIALGDRRGYNAYYAVLTGEKKGGSSLLDDQKKMLSDPKKMARFGFEQGIGFVPFGGIGYTGFKILTKDDSSPVRAAAAKILADDPDPVTLQALVNAASDKSWIVRMAALDSLARRNDPSIVSQIDSKLDDRNDAVRYTAAAAIIRLSQVKSGPATKRERNRARRVCELETGNCLSSSSLDGATWRLNISRLLERFFARVAGVERFVQLCWRTLGSSFRPRPQPFTQSTTGG